MRQSWRLGEGWLVCAVFGCQLARAARGCKGCVIGMRMGWAIVRKVAVPVWWSAVCAGVRLGGEGGGLG